MSRPSELLAELATAARSRARAPAVSLAVIATLALALGPGTALLSLLEQIYWKALPVEAPEQLVVFDPPRGPFSGSTSIWSQFSVPLSYPEFRRFSDWEEKPFSGVAARAPVGLALAYEGKTDEVIGELVSGNFFDLVGVNAAHGRLLAPQDDVTESGHPVVALSWGAWQRRFGGDPGVVGKNVAINGHPMTIVGVAPREYTSFEIGFAPELWMTMAMKPVATPLWNGLDNPRMRWLNVVARLAPGVSVEAAEARLNELYRKSSQEILEATADTHDAEFQQRFVDRKMKLLPGVRGRSDLRGEVGNALSIVLALVLLLFALACANLANLFAARATRHERELTVRLALGATRGALVRRLLIEAGVLSTVAVALGSALALALPRFAPALLPESLAAVPPRLSPVLLALAVGLVVAATLGCGLLPALVTTRGEIAERLRATAGSALGGAHGGRLRRLLVAVQVALSASILVGAGLLVRTLDRLADRDPGFDTANVLRVSINPRLVGYTLEAEGALVDRLEVELARLPGVEAVGRAEMPLLSNWESNSSIEIAGVENDDMQTRTDVVSTDYFRALGIGVHQGRAFTAADAEGAAPVALVNRKFVADYLPNGDALGRVVELRDEKVTIVGVVDDILTSNLREEQARLLYRPFAQTHDGSATTFYLRTANPEAVAAGVRRTISAIDPQLPLVDLHTLESQARRSLALERSTAGIAAGLGGVAALLAAIGLYGVLGYAVDARRRELALRAVLGAAPTELGRWVVAHAAPPVLGGLAVGLAAALAAGRLLGGLLFGIAPRDPTTFALVGLGVVVVATLAAAAPAARALGIEPAHALREE
jgi:predicted permease